MTRFLLTLALWLFVFSLLVGPIISNPRYDGLTDYEQKHVVSEYGSYGERDQNSQAIPKTKKGGTP